jgi:hypothetical protein
MFTGNVGIFPFIFLFRFHSFGLRIDNLEIFGMAARQLLMVYWSSTVSFYDGLYWVFAGLKKKKIKLSQ